MPTYEGTITDISYNEKGTLVAIDMKNTDNEGQQVAIGEMTPTLQAVLEEAAANKRGIVITTETVGGKRNAVERLNVGY